MGLRGFTSSTAWADVSCVRVVEVVFLLLFCPLNAAGRGSGTAYASPSSSSSRINPGAAPTASRFDVPPCGETTRALASSKNRSRGGGALTSRSLCLYASVRQDSAECTGANACVPKNSL
ncbi:hypothetical protein GUJ93_ZPchr0006g44083 [Zizania palustris]|uniref:Uncharacterized protein n=1 Tax=Zizania palustris TaxID=103762 RepID=A0A8J5SAP2_ZIZPA|nr:hypothetical protein GUJ93_ZPchr0006g44083 [Zizania palustris]